jgi:hypothetical protein
MKKNKLKDIIRKSPEKNYKVKIEFNISASSKDEIKRNIKDNKIVFKNKNIKEIKKI